MWSFFVLAAIFAIGTEVAAKTKSVLSVMLVATILYLLGYWSGLIPPDSIASTGLNITLMAFGLPIMIVNLGTMMDVNQFLAEWKTVVISAAAMLGLILMCFTVGIALFGREFSLVALAPIGGGSVATLIVTDACEKAGRTDLAGFAALIFALQILIGMPVSSFLLRKQLDRMLSSGHLVLREPLDSGAGGKLRIRRLSWNNAPAWWRKPYAILARLALVGIVSIALSEWTGIPVAALYLVLGVLFCQLGFLEKDSLQTASFYPFFMMMQMSNPPRLISSVTWESLKGMVIPVFGLLLLGAVGLSIFGLMAGCLFKLPWRTSVSISLCAMMGYPSTLLVSEGAVSSLQCTKEQRQAARDYVLPKMLIGGFTTVSFFSVFVASIISSVIFS